MVEDVVEYVLPELASEMFAYIEQGCASGSRMVSDCSFSAAMPCVETCTVICFALLMLLLLTALLLLHDPQGGDSERREAAGPAQALWAHRALDRGL